MIQVEQLPLWDVLRKTDDTHRDNVKKLIEGAASILDRVVETFPTYTLHNSTHAKNVVRLMAELLGPAKNELNPLEAAILLLSAFYHDIGMVFDQDARDQLPEEPEWTAFLETKPDAYLAVKKAGGVPVSIAEWYCRWRHAERVDIYLSRIPTDRLKWGHNSLQEMLGNLCESHNHDVAELYKLPVDFRGEADLRFCALLLRIADILDFDNTRTPEEVYEYLGLSRRTEPRKAESDVEWRKHLCSEGFRFPDQRTEGYLLPFIAGPNEPGVEHDVREFLDIIDGELEKCRAVQMSCSNRWRTLPLPRAIECSNILGNGYRYGAYRFTLDQAQVMDLLMGESLYRDSYVFVRELIQNALDTSRHRRFIESTRGNPDFKATPIQVRQWIDNDGYQWIRFDDEGMGMDEEIIKKHLLKVGSSYYRSSNFQAEILRAQEKTQENFVPVSRFGIGLLSCFMVGDRVEISTLRRAVEGETAEPIRLSMNGLHGFFTLQTPKLTAKPMPAPIREDPGYRYKPGSSIAVRLDPRKEKESFDLESHLQRFLSCPPVPVELDGERIGGDPEILVNRPWCDNLAYTLSSDQMSSVEANLGAKFTEPFQIIFLPVDLTKHSPTRELKGQIAIAFLKITEELQKFETQNRLTARLSYDQSAVALRLNLSSGRPGGEALTIDFPDELREIARCRAEDALSWLSHNGVAIKTIETSTLGLKSALSGVAWCDGILALYDSLRPELSVSRDGVIGLPWSIYSAGGLALYRALSEAGCDLRGHHWELFNDDPSRGSSLDLGKLLEDEHLRNDAGWASLPIIQTEEGILSIQEVQEYVRHRPLRITSLPVLRQGYRSFLTWCSATLVQTSLDAAVEMDASMPSIIVRGSTPPRITEGHKLFSPLSFLPFIGSDHLGAQGITLNSNHPFSIWLLETAPEIAKRYPGLFEQIRHNLLEGRSWESFYVGRVNSILDRLRELHPTVRPPKKFVLRQEDFHTSEK